MNIRLTLSIEDVEVVLAALAEKPLRESLILWTTIQRQAEEQRLASEQRTSVKRNKRDVPKG